MIDPIQRAGDGASHEPVKKKELPHPGEFALPSEIGGKEQRVRRTLPRFEALDEAEKLSQTPASALCATASVLGNSRLPHSKKAQMVVTEQVIACLSTILHHHLKQP